jgi:hypothetical protein
MRDTIVSNDSIVNIFWPRPVIKIIDLDTCFLFRRDKIKQLTVAKISCTYLENTSFKKDSIITNQKDIISSNNKEINIQENRYDIEKKNHSITKNQLKKTKTTSTIKQGVLIFIIGLIGTLSLTK